ncbi:MAG: HAD hydrolase family protein [Pyrinomonadaceae bacterium]|nr:HAD hydrolase family protein [Pyrinomonadaceae bacterium]
MNIYLDFDGTIVEHDYPRIGKLNPNSLEIIKKLQETGHTVILNTMRIEFEDDSMQEALDFINRNETVSGINISQKTEHKVFPKKWNLDKIENDLYIDDIAPNIPLINATEVEGLMVDWVKIEKQLTEKGIL